MRTLNLGILAHVDAGKTTLTERLLYETGVIAELGSVDDGSTQTDSLPLERQRGITIRSAVVAFPLGDITVNLIDTPGHPEFIAEVERVLSVLDGVVLVVSAVEGVQAQTRVLMRVLRRLRIPAIVFVNKIDRLGASEEGTLARISGLLTAAAVPMGTVRDIGTRAAAFIPYGQGDAPFDDRLTDLLVAEDDALLSAFVDDERSVRPDQLRAELVRQTQRASVYPVFFGSAITGAGLGPLMAGVEELLPATAGDAHGAPSGVVFKIERGPAGERIAYVRLFSGALRVRDRVLVGRREEKVTGLHAVDPSRSRSGSIAAGQIGKVWGLSAVRVGDAIGTPRGSHPVAAFPPPTLETVVVPRDPADRTALHVALARLAEQDPLIDLRVDDDRHELFVSLYGEVQRQVLQATLANDHGIDVGFRGATTICIERPAGAGDSLERLGDGNPFLASLGVRVEPAKSGSGVGCRVEPTVGSMPLYIYRSPEGFRRAMEANVRDAMREGLYGWQVTDCTVAITQAGYRAPSTTARDFRLLTPLVLMRALQRAGTTVCEPILRFHLDVPSDAVRPTLQLLARLGAVPDPPMMRGPSCEVGGEIPAARVRRLQQRLPGLSRGEGVLDFAFERYDPVRGRLPTRPRSDHHPLNRKGYLLHVLRRTEIPSA